jgi:hypothetical protein
MTVPVNEPLRRRLLRLAEEDQVHARAVYEASQRHAPHRGRFLFDIPRDEWLPEYCAAEKTAHMRTEELFRIVTEHGWPGSSMVGEDGCRAAWLLAQHAGKVDGETQRLCEFALATAVVAGDAKPGQLAALRDRIALEAGERQLYGTHLEPDGDSWRAVRGLDDEAAVDERRRALGLNSWRDYLAACLRGVMDT